MQQCFLSREDLDTAIAADWTNPLAFPYTTYGPIEIWCFDSNVTDMSFLFQSMGAEPTQDISGWVWNLMSRMGVAILLLLTFLLFSLQQLVYEM